jgi:flagellin
MALVLNTNISSLVAQNALTSSSNQLATALEQLSTGLRINTAADDAAGYAIVQGMTSQINGMTQAEQNANDGVSLVQTASGALTEITNDLQSMRSLAVESLNATNSGTDRADLNTQFQQLMQDIDSVAANTQFNGVTLLNGSFQGANFQIGANPGQSIQVDSIANMHTTAIGGYNVTGSTDTTGALSNAAILTLTVGGQTYNINSSVAGSEAGQTADSAYSIAAAINAANTGIIATANPTTWTMGAAAGGGTAAMAGNFTINGVQVNIDAGQVTTAAATAANMASDINAVSTQTGVTASVNAAGVLVLTASDGRDINVANFTATAGGVTAADVGLTNAAAGAGTLAGVSETSTITLSGSSPYTVGGTGLAAAGFTGGSVTAVNTSVASLDVGSVATANTALTTLTAALQEVATLGAQLGAYQNRFQAASSGLATDITNLTSARSTVQDTDYAAATSQLSQAQILQQAGTAMVAQANTIPQNVLTLLQHLP